MILRWWIWLTLPAMAFGATCPELNALWLAKYQPQFGVEIKRNVFRCEEEKDFIIAQTIDDLHAADSDHSFYQVARSLIHKINVGVCEDRVAAQMGSHNRVTLCAPFFKLSRIKRAAALFHEASHGRQKDPGHVICEQGEAEGKLTCDAALNEGFDGSGHNWEAHYARFLFQNSADEALVKEAKNHMKHLLENRINGLNDTLKTAWLK